MLFGRPVIVWLPPRRFYIRMCGEHVAFAFSLQFSHTPNVSGHRWRTQKQTFIHPPTKLHDDVPPMVQHLTHLVCSADEIPDDISDEFFPTKSVHQKYFDSLYICKIRCPQALRIIGNACIRSSFVGPSSATCPESFRRAPIVCTCPFPLRSSIHSVLLCLFNP